MWNQAEFVTYWAIPVRLNASSSARRWRKKKPGDKRLKRSHRSVFIKWWENGTQLRFTVDTVSIREGSHKDSQHPFHVRKKKKQPLVTLYLIPRLFHGWDNMIIMTEGTGVRGTSGLQMCWSWVVQIYLHAESPLWLLQLLAIPLWNVLSVKQLLNTSLQWLKLKHAEGLLPVAVISCTALVAVIMWALNSCQSHFTPDSPEYTFVYIFN